MEACHGEVSDLRSASPLLGCMKEGAQKYTVHIFVCTYFLEFSPTPVFSKKAAPSLKHEAPDVFQQPSLSVYCADLCCTVCVCRPDLVYFYVPLCNKCHVGIKTLHMLNVLLLKTFVF